MGEYWVPADEIRPLGSGAVGVARRVAPGAGRNPALRKTTIRQGLLEQASRPSKPRGRRFESSRARPASCRARGFASRRRGSRRSDERSYMPHELQGKRVAILAADMFEQVELVEPRKALEQ